MEEKNNIINYKIMPGRIYTVNRSDYGENTFYKIQVEKHNLDQTKSKCYKMISFIDDVDIEDGTKIRINAGYESFYMKDKYNAIFTVVVTDFDIVNESSSVEKNDAIENYNKILQEVEMPF